MSNFNFEGLTVHTKKCLYISDNKAIVRNKKLYNIGDLLKDIQYKNLYVEECARDAKTHNDHSDIYLDFGIVCMYCNNTMDGWTTTDQLQWKLKSITDITLNQALTAIRSYPENNQFVNVADIKLIELSGASQEEVQSLANYRTAWYNRKEQEYQERELKRHQEEKEYVKNKNNEVTELIKLAEQAIINKKIVINKNITIYKAKYDSSDTSLILHMMKLYDINVPLKTQGWINQALANISCENDYGEYSYSYYTSSKNSTVFNKYLQELIRKVNGKYGIIKYNSLEDEDTDIQHLFGRVV